ncbi:NAD(P)/FAD-dependent oxidoreductase [Grimontia sp. NTOU-MAR1]|uniref:NAD(P)/FAD-dependent oxidoreductase n=1 Tax=Grimontia sp. NTOU-MAR1 TaxID=3111011 RepID=UPI002DBF073D|nr:NAD(P)/FAD-dependent oxidoreductase [Grimontia sp. NTOU-MAR1]WRV97185.1 NAD(P)/FAD-dependent oxidoreductase [Grimontia sp. NTOU-MAR1]
MRLETTQVAIIGAGPSGAIAAALLNQKGIDVLVLEKATFPRFSIGESLLPACMESIRAAGMLEAVNAAGFQFKNGAAFNREGRYISFDFTDKFSAGVGTTYQVQRAVFDKVLADDAERQGVTIRYQHEIEAVDVNADKPVLHVKDEQGKHYQLQADFILDASGFGRVLPRLLDLESPSCLPPRQAIFTHIVDNIDAAEYDRDKILISVHPDNHDVWYWLIPFSNGTCSFGIVGEPDFFANYADDHIAAIKQLASEEPWLAKLLMNAEYPNQPGMIGGYSANVSTLATDKFALLGNAGEFLDPVFSSGVTIAMKSAELAVNSLSRQLSGEKVDWLNEYEKPLLRGVDTFRCYVEGWYKGTLQDVIFYPNPDPKIKGMVCSILAGYAWDTDNPYVDEPVRRLDTLAKICAET